MTITKMSPLDLLNAIELPVEDGQVMWNDLSNDQITQVTQGLCRLLVEQEPDTPTDGLLERSLAIEETSRYLLPAQHRYAGLLQDAFDTPRLRSTIGLPKGKTPFRDAADMLAKTHGLRAYESNSRMNIARSLTPVRSTDKNRDDEVPVGETRYPLLGAIQTEGTVHPSKLSTAINMLDALDTHAQDAGKDKTFRDRIRSVIEQDLVQHIEHTTPEEFSRYVSRRKADLIASFDPPDQQFTDAQTQRMHNLWSEGAVRGNPNAYKWSLIVDSEGNEALKTIESLANNPRAGKSQAQEDSDTADPQGHADDAEAHQDEDSPDDAVPDTRTRGQRSMHALRDAIKFAISHIGKSGLPGARGNHTTMVVLADYPTLLQHLKDELTDLLREISEYQRDKLLELLAEQDFGGAPPDTAGISPPSVVPRDGTLDEHDPRGHPVSGKTTDVNQILDDQNLDRLQSRIAQGIYTPNYPADTLLRLLCDVSVSPVTLTGTRQILSIGQERRAFPDHMRRAIVARDRGCTVPGCHWPAAWCEIHHVIHWSNDGETSTENGLMLCGHHHQALHNKMLSIQRSDGEISFIQHPLIDPAQQPRRNHFWQN